MTDDTRALRAILADQDRAWCAGDAEAFGAATVPEVIFTNILGLFSIGREPFEAQHRHIFATFYRGSTLRQTVEHIAFATPDVAIVNSLTELSGLGALPSAIHASDGVLNTRLEQVMVRTGEGWRVAAFHNVVVNPQAAAAAPPGPGTPAA